MGKVYCIDCFWRREFKQFGGLNHIQECSLDICFEGGEEVIDTPFKKEKIDTTKRIKGIDILNKNNDCPHFKKATIWEQIKHSFDIWIEPQ